MPVKSGSIAPSAKRGSSERQSASLEWAKKFKVRLQSQAITLPSHAVHAQPQPAFLVKRASAPCLVKGRPARQTDICITPRVLSRCPNSKLLYSRCGFYPYVRPWPSSHANAAAMVGPSAPAAARVARAGRANRAGRKPVAGSPRRPRLQATQSHSTRCSLQPREATARRGLRAAYSSAHGASTGLQAGSANKGEDDRSWTWCPSRANARAGCTLPS